MLKEAILSPCGTWRYTLLRQWDPELLVLPVVMVNPSTADHEVNDPTILTLIARAKFWGYGGILVVNLLALRSSTQDALLKHPDPTGPENPDYVSQVMEYAKNNEQWVLVAWGNGGDIVLPGSHWSEAQIFLDRFEQDGIEFRCLGKTSSGAPKHPLARGKHRVPNDFQPVPFSLDGPA